MAKVNLVSLGHHHDNFWKLAKSLKSRSIDLRIWLSRSDALDDLEVSTNDFEVLTPFKKRTVKEVSESLLRITVLPTEVFHVHLGANLDVCDHLFYQALKLLPQHRVILHLTDSLIYNIRHHSLNQISVNQLNRFRFWERVTSFFCYGTKAITVENYSQLVWLHQSIRNRQKNQRMILPPLIQTHRNPNFETEPTSIYFDLVSRDENTAKIQTLCIPLTHAGISSRCLENLKILHKHFAVFFFGDFEKMKESTLNEYRQIFSDHQKTHHQPFFFHQWDQKTRLPLKGRTAFFIAGLDLPTYLTAAIVEQSMILHRPVIFDTEQSMIYSGLWSHGKNCLIFDRREAIKRTAHLIPKLNEVPQQFFEKTEFEFDHQSLDTAVNELSRVYKSVIA
ncbi:MAG: hypothetical protein ACK5WZ_08760 [Pseudobdellovibrionaceae bacterium]